MVLNLHNIIFFGWLCVYNEQRNMTTGNLTEHFIDFTQGDINHNTMDKAGHNTVLALVIPIYTLFYCFICVFLLLCIVCNTYRF